jgi:DNA-binding CsgD family transcriptional regulator
MSRRASLPSVSTVGPSSPNVTYGTEFDRDRNRRSKAEERLSRQYSVVASRIPPILVVVDLNLGVLSWSPNSGVASMILQEDTDLREAVRASCARREQIIHILDGDILLRIVPMESQTADCAVIMVESFGHRGSISRAAKIYGLTKRETEILGLVVQGMSNAEIAETLYVAQSTVADHLKNVMRKTQTSKRLHLLSKVTYGNPGETLDD